MSSLVDKVWKHPLFILVAATVVYLAIGLGHDGMNLDSATYSVIARNMAEDGRWLNPTYTDFYLQQFRSHPPLVMWVDALIFLILGVNDSTARLFGGLCTVGAIAFAFMLGREAIDRRFGFLSGLTLLLTYNFIQNGNSNLLDVPLTFFMLVVLWGLVRQLKTGLTCKLSLVTGAALGCAFLSKGVVSAPAWLALAGTVIFIRRNWIRSLRFWIIPGCAMVMILVYLLLDWVYTGGHFLHGYFFDKLWSRWLGGEHQQTVAWWHFSYRFVELYLPFIVLLPIGVYLMLRRRISVLYPTAIALAAYIVLTSRAVDMYLHYFVPAYAFSAPLVALPLYVWLREPWVKQLATGFTFIWLAAAIAILATDLRMHHIRSPQIYGAREEMRSLLDNHPTRYGLYVSADDPNWEYIAKTAWYWKSDIKQVASIEKAESLLQSDTAFAYILIDSEYKLGKEQLSNRGFRTYYDGAGIVVYVPTKQPPLERRDYAATFTPTASGYLQLGGSNLTVSSSSGP